MYYSWCRRHSAVCRSAAFWRRCCRGTPVGSRRCEGTQIRSLEPPVVKLRHRTNKARSRLKGSVSAHLQSRAARWVLKGRRALSSVSCKWNLFRRKYLKINWTLWPLQTSTKSSFSCDCSCPLTSCVIFPARESQSCQFKNQEKKKGALLFRGSLLPRLTREWGEEQRTFLFPSPPSCFIISPLEGCHMEQNSLYHLFLTQANLVSS